jgi:lipopolysaccharide transport system ATP-binding protein
MSDVLIKVEGVSKKFCRSLKKSLWYAMQDLGREITGRRHGGNGDLRQDEFWAVKDVSFELKRGECLGLIGHNGAGKTTLLRLLNGLIKPDAGRIEMRGRVGALIALGAGFNPILTGRENIYVNASVLGLSKRQIDEKLDEIIDFAEIGEFSNAPVQSYSSGMQVRLGFAVATAFAPEVVILDEVLAVGDMDFQKKCSERIAQLLNDGERCIIVVGHNIRQVQRISSRMLLLDKGMAVVEGDPVQVAQLYYAQVEGLRRSQLLSFDANSLAGTGDISIDQVQLLNAAGGAPEGFVHGEDIIVRISFGVIKSVCDIEIAVGIDSADQLNIATESSGRQDLLAFSPGRYVFDFRFIKPMLLPGDYSLRLFFHHTLGMNLVSGSNVVRFCVSAGASNRADFSTSGVVRFASSWEVRNA